MILRHQESLWYNVFSPFRCAHEKSPRKRWDSLGPVARRTEAAGVCDVPRYFEMYESKTRTSFQFALPSLMNSRWRGASWYLS